jgi:hypothetical protein
MPTPRKRTTELILWLSPLLHEVKERGLDTKREKEEAGGVGEFDYELYGRLLIKLLGWEDNYPQEPAKPLIKPL